MTKTDMEKVMDTNMSKTNTFFICGAAVLIILGLVGGMAACTARRSDNQRRVQTDCIDHRGTWAGGHCVYPVGP